MLESVVENKIVNKLYNDANWVFTEFYSTNSNIKDFIDIARDIDMSLDNWDLRYKHLSIYGSPAQHGVNVAILNAKIGSYFKLDNSFDLILGGLLHDIGKFYIRENIREKPGILSDEEKVEMAKHSDIGYNLLKDKLENCEVLEIVKNHHFVINNLPYPMCVSDVISKKEIAYPLICGISDITDAMLSHRVYKKPLTIQETKYELTNKGVLDVEPIFRQIL